MIYSILEWVEGLQVNVILFYERFQYLKIFIFIEGFVVINYIILVIFYFILIKIDIKLQFIQDIKYIQLRYDSKYWKVKIS